MQINKFGGYASATLISISSLATAQDLGIRPLPIAPKIVATNEPATAPSAVLAVPVAATANPHAQALPIEQRWELKAGETIGQNLKTWAGRAHWTVIWQLPHDWIVPAGKSFPGNFPDAAASVIENLAANGGLINAQIFDGNKTIVISGPGVAPQ
jgi:hypothetical protein